MPTYPDLLASSPLSLDAALDVAIAAAKRAQGTTYPNPPVGCVILDAKGIPAGVAATEPVGGAHAEPQALAMAGARAVGGTAVVTLEPCNHEGRTPPCTQALINAGVARVVFAVTDPNPVAAGGAEYLKHNDIEVIRGFESARVADGYLRPWLHWQRTRTPHITLKTAGTLDGLAAATDGTSQWITGEVARERVHRDRSRRQAILVGSGTVRADDPRLTARKPDGSLYENQPLRIVVGHSDVPEDALIRGENFRQIRTREPEKVVEVLADLGIIDCVLEGGPSLASAFLNAGLIDAVDSYVAPAMLGAGRPLVATQEATSISDITRFRLTRVKQLGNDVLISAVRAGE